MVLEIWIKIPLGCESPPLKKPHVLVGATSQGIPLSLLLWGEEPLGAVLHHRLHPE